MLLLHFRNEILFQHKRGMKDERIRLYSRISVHSAISYQLPRIDYKAKNNADATRVIRDWFIF